MHNCAKTPANSGRSQHQPIYKSRFALAIRSARGIRIICAGLTFSQAAALVAEIPASVVKFERMEAV